MKQLILLVSIMTVLILTACSPSKNIVQTTPQKDHVTTVDFLYLFQKNGIEINEKESNLGENLYYIVGKIRRTNLEFIITIPTPEKTDIHYIEHLIWTLPLDTDMLLFTR